MKCVQIVCAQINTKRRFQGHIIFKITAMLSKYPFYRPVEGDAGYNTGNWIYYMGLIPVTAAEPFAHQEICKEYDGDLAKFYTDIEE